MRKSGHRRSLSSIDDESKRRRTITQLNRGEDRHSLARAERLEHFISERLEDRIAAKLGDPDTDPHGHSIPERNGKVRTREEVPLSSWVCCHPAIISSVSDRDPAALREMEGLGLLPGVCVVVEPGNRGASLMVRIGADAQAVRLNQKLVAAISVAPAPRSSSPTLASEEAR